MDLSQLLPFKLEVDDRQPLAIFSVPFDNRHYAFYAPSTIFWVETLAAMGAICVLAGLLSFVTYKHIVLKQGSTISYLIGFGFLIPLWIVLPFHLIEVLDLRNKVIKFAVAAVVPTLAIFKTTEAMYGCVPAQATASNMAYYLYCSSPMMLLYNQKVAQYVRCTFSETMLQLGIFVYKLTILGAIQSFATPSGLRPFGSPSGEWYDPERLVNPHQYMDNLVYAFLFQMYLSAYCEGLIAGTMLLTGLKCETVMENPLMQSSSLTELWGKKWNKLVEGVLKRGVYIPLRKSGLSKIPASFGTFLASGLFHEWLLAALYKPMRHELSPDGSCQSPACYIAPLGGQTAFMLWNAIAIVGENIIWNNKVVKQIAYILPAPIRTMIVIAPGVVVAHWFVEPYTMSNFFAHGQVSLPMWLPLEEAVQ